MFSNKVLFKYIYIYLRTHRLYSILLPFFLKLWINFVFRQWWACMVTVNPSASQYLALVQHPNIFQREYLENWIFQQQRKNTDAADYTHMMGMRNILRDIISISCLIQCEWKIYKTKCLDKQMKKSKRTHRIHSLMCFSLLDDDRIGGNNYHSHTH